jgi:ADP-ribose pyrophosphatase YjhB (NUDIX family)
MARKKSNAHVVVLNGNGQVLCVSRKEDHNDFGLPGGKIEKSDESKKSAAIRETLEETGIIVTKATLIYAEHRRGAMGYTYLATQWEGEIGTDEPHVVKWGEFTDLVAGTYGEWNLKVFKSLSDYKKRETKLNEEKKENATSDQTGAMNGDWIEVISDHEITEHSKNLEPIWIILEDDEFKIPILAQPDGHDNYYGADDAVYHYCNISHFMKIQRPVFIKNDD